MSTTTTTTKSTTTNPAPSTALAAFTAHRGDSSRFRENTLPAIRSAIARGAATVEIDVRLTLDGEVVVLHDPTLSRLWGLDRPVAELTLAEVSGLGGGDQRIPTLAEVVAEFDADGPVLLIDMDSADPAAAAVAVVAAVSGERRVAWCGLREAMEVVRALDDDAEIWMPWASSEAPGVDDVAGLRPAVLNLPHLVVGRRLVDDVHALGLRVSCWTVDDTVQMHWLDAIGVDSITTNRLDLAESLCESLVDSAEERELQRAALVARALAAWANDYTRSHGVGTIGTKSSPADHVTEVDTAIEKAVRMVVGAQFPDHRFVGEEFGGTADGAAPCWYLDPVDGTANLANGVPWTSFSLALVVGGVPVVAVVGDPWRGHVVEARAGFGARLDGRELVLAAATGAAATGAADPLEGMIVSTELAGHRPWPGMNALVDGLAAHYCTTRVMGSGTMTVTGVALGHGVGAVIGSFGPVDHLAAVLIVVEAGGVVLDETGEATLFPTAGGVLAARDEPTARALHALWRDALDSEV